MPTRNARDDCFDSERPPRAVYLDVVCGFGLVLESEVPSRPAQARQLQLIQLQSCTLYHGRTKTNIHSFTILPPSSRLSIPASLPPALPHPLPHPCVLSYYLSACLHIFMWHSLTMKNPVFLVCCRWRLVRIQVRVCSPVDCWYA